MGGHNVEVPRLLSAKVGALRPPSESRLPEDVVRCLGNDGMRVIASLGTGVLTGFDFFIELSNRVIANGYDFDDLRDQLEP
jgi:hypothetical protein